MTFINFLQYITFFAQAAGAVVTPFTMFYVAMAARQYLSHFKRSV